MNSEFFTRRQNKTMEENSKGNTLSPEVQELPWSNQWKANWPPVGRPLCVSNLRKPSPKEGAELIQSHATPVALGSCSPWSINFCPLILSLCLLGICEEGLMQWLLNEKCLCRAFREHTSIRGKCWEFSRPRTEWSLLPLGNVGQVITLCQLRLSNW